MHSVCWCSLKGIRANFCEYINTLQLSDSFSTLFWKLETLSVKYILKNKPNQTLLLSTFFPALRLEVWALFLHFLDKVRLDSCAYMKLHFIKWVCAFSFLPPFFLHVLKNLLLRLYSLWDWSISHWGKTHNSR